jgi:hypothetical protein
MKMFMKKNMGNIDRGIRLLIALLITGLYFSGILSGTLGLVLMVVAGLFVFTSFVAICPLYSLLGFNTCGIKKT